MPFSCEKVLQLAEQQAEALDSFLFINVCTRWGGRVKILSENKGCVLSNSVCVCAMCTCTVLLSEGKECTL